jgi:hypothetical protein
MCGVVCEAIKFHAAIFWRLIFIVYRPLGRRIFDCEREQWAPACRIEGMNGRVEVSALASHVPQLLIERASQTHPLSGRSYASNFVLIFMPARPSSVCVCVWRLWEKLFSQTSWPEYSENDASFGIRFKNLKTHTERQRHICTPGAVHFINPFSWFLLLIILRQKNTHSLPLLGSTHLGIVLVKSHTRMREEGRL